MVVVPEGQYPPFEVIDDTHHAGIIIITAAICMVISLVCLLIRVYVRLLLSPPFGIDDLILLGATIFGIVESVIVFYTASIGFGTAISLLPEDAIWTVQRSLAASDVLYLITLYLSKCCIIAIYLRLTPRQSHKTLLWGTFSLSTLGVFISIVILTADCALNRPWVTPAESCSNLFSRWQFITALDIITELFLFIFSIALVYGLQMSYNHKSIIMISFAARLPILIFTSLRLAHLHTYTTSTNPSFDAIPHSIYTQIELNYSLISCTVFCLRPFMNAVSTSYGTAGDENLESSSRSRSGYASRSRSTQHSYALRSLNQSTISPEPVPEGLFLPKDRPHGETVITGGDENSIRSDASTRMIIQKNVEYAVYRSDRE